MDPKSNGGGMFFAPHASTVAESSARSLGQSSEAPRRQAPVQAPGAPASFPPVDQHIVQPEVTYDEIIRGRKVSAMTALYPHAEAQNTLAFLIAPHVKPGFRALTELLTRAAVGSDFGTDVCVCREGTDPETGSRYLEEISFEVINEQRIGDITDKAEDLVTRGVRRVFGIFIKKAQVCEWSKEQNKFVALDKDGSIEDPLFIRPIAIKALIDYAQSEDEVARALILKGNSAIEAFKQDVRKQAADEGRKQGLDEGRKRGLDEGKLDGRRETLLEQANDRFGSVPADVEAKIRSANLEQLRQWSKRLLLETSMDDVFGGD
jgi:hypothetical protein